MRGVGHLSGLTKEEMFSDVANIESLPDKLEVPEEVLALMEELRPGQTSSQTPRLTFFKTDCQRLAKDTDILTFQPNIYLILINNTQV